MVELFEANWPILLLALLIGSLIAWYIFHARRTTRVSADRRDVLDEGADRARRNHALLDAPTRPVTPTPDLPPEPQTRSTGSFPLPGAVAGVETAVNAAAGTPHAVSLAEQEEREALQGRADTDPWRVVPAAPPEPDEGTDLTRLKGVGPKLALRLNELGIARIEQIAAWDDAEVDRVDRELGQFQGRIRRDDWVAQARLLAAGDRAAYEARFGRL